MESHDAHADQVMVRRAPRFAGHSKTSACLTRRLRESREMPRWHRWSTLELCIANICLQGDFITAASSFTTEQFVFLDEMGSDMRNLERTHGYAPIGSQWV